MGNLLYYNKPAEVWEEAMPLGNGSLGAMVYGGAELERIALNLDTLWSGSVRNDNEADRTEALAKIRGLIDNGDYIAAHKEGDKSFNCEDVQTYLPLGEMQLRQISSGEISQYRRELDLSSAYSKVSFVRTRRLGGDCEFSRRYFITYPHKAMIIEYKSSVREELNLSVGLTSDLKNIITCNNGEVIMQGKAPSAGRWHNHQGFPLSYDGGETIGYCFKLKVITDGTVENNSNCVSICNATRVCIIATGETNFTAYNTPPDEKKHLEEICNERIGKVLVDGVEQVFNTHVCDYRNLYERMSIDLHTKEPDLPIDERLYKIKNGNEDIDLAETVFNFGRYLMISGSRKDTQAMNLQGIWNNNISPPWASDYTTNINTQMNYWAAEICNLSELHEPLIKMIKELFEAGRTTAKQFYGAGGFCVHHNTDIWRKTTPASGNSRWVLWPMAGVWFCRHLWEHYQYSGDKEFLGKFALPITESCVEFLSDFMIEDNGILLTSPSTSPENAFLIDGEQCSVTKGTAMDRMLVIELINHYLYMCKLMEYESEITKIANEMYGKLADLEIDSLGRIMEWDKEHEESEKGHRHQSQLYGLYPGDIITNKNSKLLKACRRSLEYRLEHGGGGTGWSGAWIINLFARLCDGEKAGEYVNRFIKNSLYSSLLDAHPPFQIDGNFGYTSGVAEMMIQSHTDTIWLLPALPPSWKNGTVKGICARGGISVDFEWEDNKITSVTVHASVDGVCRIGQSPDNVREFIVKAGESYKI